MANSEIVNKNYLECMETESINVSMYWDGFLEKAGIRTLYLYPFILSLF